MKKTIACLLAGVMTVTALPINVMAAPQPRVVAGTGNNATVRLSGTRVPVAEGWTIVENGVSTVSRRDTVEGNNLFIQFNETIADTIIAPQFDLILENAEWAFQAGGQTNFHTERGRMSGDIYTRIGQVNGRDVGYQIEFDRVNPRRATVTVTHELPYFPTFPGTPAVPELPPGPGVGIPPMPWPTFPTPVTEDIAVEASVTKPDLPKPKAPDSKKTMMDAVTVDAMDPLDELQLELQRSGVRNNVTREQGDYDEALYYIYAAINRVEHARTLVYEGDANDAATTYAPIFQGAGDVTADLALAANYEITDAIVTEMLTAVPSLPAGVTNRASLTTYWNGVEGTDPTYLTGAQRSAIVTFLEDHPDLQEATTGETTLDVVTQDVDYARTAIANAKAELAYFEDRTPEFASEQAIAALDSADASLVLAEGVLADPDTPGGVAPLWSATGRSDLNRYLGDAYDALRTAEELLDVYGEDETGTLPRQGITINSGDTLTIPLIVNRTTGEEAIVRIVESRPIPVNNSSVVFTEPRSRNATMTSINTPSQGRDRIIIGSVGVRELRPGVLQSGVGLDANSFRLIAPNGFSFVGALTDIDVILQGGLRTANTNWGNYEVTRVPGSEGRELLFTYSNLAPSVGVTGQMVIEGLNLISEHPDRVFEGEIALRIEGSQVHDEYFTVANVADWGVDMTVRTGGIPTLINGRLSSFSAGNLSNAAPNNETHRAARIRLRETVPGSILGQRSTTLTLPDGVKAIAVRVEDTRNITNAANFTNNSSGQPLFFNERGRTVETNSSFVRIHDNVITLAGLEIEPNQRAEIDLDVWLSIEAGFEGDIDVTLGGSSINGTTNDNPSLTIAEAINPVRVEAEMTNIRVGYQFVPVGDFKVIENVHGALINGEEVFISVTDEFLSELHVAHGFNARVTDGNLRITTPRASNNLGFVGNNQSMGWRTGTNIVFEVDRASTTGHPSTIEFNNIQVRLSPITPQPQGNMQYDLIVWGPGVAPNFEGLVEPNAFAPSTGIRQSLRNDFFRTPGVIEPFVNVTGGSGSNALNLTNVVRATANNPILSVNNEQMLMDTAPYVSPVSDSFMVPVRFISMALGIDAGRVLWSPTTSTVSIDAGDRIIQFQTNSSMMMINGIELPMLNALGQPVYSEVRDDRAFIPFRALANALNVAVEWDPATATATFDPTRPSDTGFHLEDLLNGATPHYGQPYGQTVEHHVYRSYAS